MTYEVYHSKDKTTNSTHVNTIIRTKTIILAIHIHSTLAIHCIRPLQGTGYIASLRLGALHHIHHMQAHFSVYR